MAFKTQLALAAAAYVSPRLRCSPFDVRTSSTSIHPPQRNSRGSSSCAQAARGLESNPGMQRIPPTHTQFFTLMVLLGILGLLQTAWAQKSSRPQSATHEADTATEPPEIGTPPLAMPTEQKNTSPASSSALVIGPGDDLEVTVYGAPDLSGHTRPTRDRFPGATHSHRRPIGPPFPAKDARNPADRTRLAI